MMETLDSLFHFALSATRMAIPLIFAAMGGYFAERSGVTDISLEGKMLIAACIAAVVTFATGSPWLGLLAAALGATMIAGVYGFFAITLQANQIVAGAALNMLALGSVPFALNLLYGTPGSSPALDAKSSLGLWTYAICAAAVVATALIAKRTTLGTWLSFAGENPMALATAGISVARTRWTGVLMGGFVTGLGGATLSIFLSSSFSRNMTAGRGFMALAALIIGNWRPLPAAFACLLFGVVDAAQIRFLGTNLEQLKSSYGITIAPQLVQIFPYLMTIAFAAGIFGRSRPPAAIGQPHRTEEERAA